MAMVLENKVESGKNLVHLVFLGLGSPYKQKYIVSLLKCFQKNWGPSVILGITLT